MEWVQFAIMFFSMIGLWLHQDKKLDGYQKRCDDDRRDMLTILRSIQEEIKEFHGRLCEIEATRKK
jgi:hypothetical protein